MLIFKKVMSGDVLLDLQKVRVLLLEKMNITVSSRMALNMGEVDINGRMELFTMVCGYMMLEMDMALNTFRMVAASSEILKRGVLAAKVRSVS